MNRLTRFAFTVIGILLALTVYTTVQAVKWKHVADERGWRADVAFAYLAQPLTLPDGTQVSRAAALDAIVQAALKK